VDFTSLSIIYKGKPLTHLGAFWVVALAFRGFAGWGLPGEITPDKPPTKLLIFKAFQA
jgi:hypothetical protein